MTPEKISQFYGWLRRLTERFEVDGEMVYKIRREEWKKDAFILQYYGITQPFDEVIEDYLSGRLNIEPSPVCLFRRRKEDKKDKTL